MEKRAESRENEAEYVETGTWRGDFEVLIVASLRVSLDEPWEAPFAWLTFYCADFLPLASGIQAWNQEGWKEGRKFPVEDPRL